MQLRTDYERRNRNDREHADFDMNDATTHLLWTQKSRRPWACWFWHEWCNYAPPKNAETMTTGQYFTATQIIKLHTGYDERCEAQSSTVLLMKSASLQADKAWSEQVSMVLLEALTMKTRRSCPIFFLSDSPSISRFSVCSSLIGPTWLMYICDSGHCRKANQYAPPWCYYLRVIRLAFLHLK